MARWSRQILFGDVDAMFASSAIVADPSLAGKLVAVGSPPPRGIITAASYAVRPFGVKSAMPTAQALRLCPQLVLVPPNRSLYRRLHEAMRAVTDRLFPVTEWTSIDEFYADVTDLQSCYHGPHALGQAVKTSVFEATGLRCTVAIATGKTVAKVAADTHKPDGLAVIAPGAEAEFLAPQPIRALPGIGPKSSEVLERLGFRVIGDLVRTTCEAALQRAFGQRLAQWQTLACGIDRDPVVADRASKSIGHETTFDRDTSDLTVLEHTIRGFLSELAHELRLQGLAAGSFSVKLKDAAFRVTTRQRQFPKPLSYDSAMWPEIKAALGSLVRAKTAYRLVGLSLSTLTPIVEGLFDLRTNRAVSALDTILEKYGAGVIRLGEIHEKE
ncbi:MAG: DNA polymerase Y family protein [Nitrospiraceae bacterium]